MGDFELALAAREHREALACQHCDQAPKEGERVYLLELVELAARGEDLVLDELFWCEDCWAHMRRGLEDDSPGCEEEEGGREVCSCCKMLFGIAGVRLRGAPLTSSARFPPNGHDPFYTAPPGETFWLCMACANTMHALNQGCLWPDLEDAYDMDDGGGDYEYGAR